MQIGRIETFIVPPRWLFVRVETADGAFGWGEASLEGHAEAVEGAFEALRDRFTGADPRRIEDIWQVGYRGGFYRGGPVLMSALSGLDQALWDLKGRALDVPAWELLGGRVRNRIRAYAERYSGMGILHLDAHADLREAYEGFTWSHASIFNNVIRLVPGVSLVQVGVRDLGNAENQMIEGSGGRIRTFFDADIAARRENGVAFATIADEIVATLPENIYLSWDIDGLDPTLCPGTGTPVPGGLSWNEATGLLRAVIRARKRIVGLDLCEVSPGEGEWDANVGARLLYKMIGFALLSQK